MESPGASERARWAGQLGDRDLHRRLLAELRCLHEVDRVGVGSAELTGWVRVAAWNVQRGRRPTELALRLGESGADVCLLSELDSGMARTGNVDVTAAIATDLAAGYAFGVEFVELSLGDASEQREAGDLHNVSGLHGNAIVTRASLGDPGVVRLPETGLGWFATDSPQPRVGGRMAVVATVTIDGVAVEVASAHLENRGDPAHRAEQMEALLQVFGRAGPRRSGRRRRRLQHARRQLCRAVRPPAGAPMRRTDPARFSWPVPYEPLFDVARAHGFEWTDANVAAPTTAHDSRALPDHVPIRLDWLFVRGLAARRAAVVPAGGLSDHHLVSVGVRLP